MKARLLHWSQRMRNPTFSNWFLSVALVAACSSSTVPAPVKVAPAPAQSTETGGSAELLAGAALLLDVRNQDEYERGHLGGALLIPVAELESRLGEVEAAVAGDKSRKIVAYCGSGRRAGAAKQLLEQHGFSNVINGGGYEALR